MLIRMEVNVDRHPDMVGEYLRYTFFNEQSERDIGCYTVFDWREGVRPLSDEPVDLGDWIGMGDKPCWTRGEKDGIECRYYWDGDGTLAFKLVDGRWLVNTDCAKPTGWEVPSEADL
jgi:hypothetical protein